MRKLTVLSIITLAVSIISIYGYTQTFSAAFKKEISVKSPPRMDSAIKSAKIELIGNLFNSTKSLVDSNPNMDSGKPGTENLRQDYSQAVMSIENLTHTAKTFLIEGDGNEPEIELLKFLKVEKTSRTQGNVTLDYEKIQLYIDQVNTQKNKLNGILEEAQRVEKSNPQQAVKLYHTTFPIYDALNQAALLHYATQSNQDNQVTQQKLVERITQSSAGILISHREVTQKVTRLQRQLNPTPKDGGTPVTLIARKIAMQINSQSQPKDRVQMNTFTCEDTNQSSPISMDLYEAIKSELPQLKFLPLKTRGLKKLPLKLNGEFWKHDDAILVKASLSRGDSGKNLGSVNLSIPWAELELAGAQIFPDNFNEIKDHQEVFIDTHTSVNTFDGDELRAKLWTDRSDGSTTYTEGEDMTISCKVNQPAFINLLYRLEDGRYTLLYENIEITQDKAGKDHVIDTFIVEEPVGSETIILQVSKKMFSPLNTTNVEGYDFLTTDNPAKVFQLLKGNGVTVITLPVTTVKAKKGI